MHGIQAKMDFPKSFTVTTRAHRCVCWLHSRGRDRTERTLRTAYDRRGACVISGARPRTCIFMPPWDNGTQPGARDDTDTSTQTQKQMDKHQQASAVFPPQRRRCLRGRIAANNWFFRQEQTLGGVGVLFSELFKSSNQ